MPFGTTTYSPVDLTGAINSPLAGPFILSGASLGRGKIVVTMDHEWTEEDVSLDGAVMVSVSPGLQGMVEVECQQTSSINAYLKSAVNLHQTAVLGGSSVDWAAIALDLQNSVTGDQQVCTGVSFSKKPPQPYGPRGEYLKWTLRVANIANQ